MYALLGTESQTNSIRENYLKGGFGYGHAKTALFELILDKFSEQRKTYDHLMSNTSLLEKELAIGEAKATKLANEKLMQVRDAVGYN
jgi:tryptophanyl-tRNA synthetase